MDKNLNLLYFSATENTQKYLRAIASQLNSDYNEYNISSVKAREKKLEFKEDDLLIVGVPVYLGRVPELLINYFEKVKGNHTPAVFVVTYGNRAYDDALLELQDIFEENGFIGVAGGAFIGEHSNSKKIAGLRPDQDDLNFAADFGKKIKSKINNIKKLKTVSELEVNGDYPYKERHDSPDFAPKTTAACIECAICAENCPVNAISFNNFKDIDKEKCINCCSCIQKCPVDAKYMDHPHFKEITSFLIENFAEERKENQVFF